MNSKGKPSSEKTVELTAVTLHEPNDAPIVENGEGTGGAAVTVVTVAPNSISTWRSYAIVSILFFVNLLNYMDRFTVAGVLPSIQAYYHTSNTEDGLLQTAFIGTYMLCSPVFGYLGDRYIRKHIMAVGILFWSLVTFGGSFIPANSFWAFMLLRALVGVGEASYSTIAPTIIADLFSKGSRTTMLMIFYFAIPVGSGLGYIVGSQVAKAFGAWQYALRVTPILGLACVILIVFILREPERGMADGGTHLHNTSISTDIKALAKNKSFVLSTLGFTCVAFTTGALALWAPTFMLASIKSQGHKATESSVALTFGGITVAAGFIGVAIGAELSRRLKKINPRADPLICAFGLLTCTPFLFFSLFLSRYNTPATYVLIFIGETLLCLNWPIVADMLLYVVIPTRRSSAEAVQILISHLLGDAGSPYLIGQVADILSKNYDGDPTLPSIQFVTLQTSLYITTFICVIGGGFFLATAMFIEDDRNNAEKVTQVGDYEQEIDPGTGLNNPGFDEFVNEGTTLRREIQNNKPY